MFFQSGSVQVLTRNKTVHDKRSLEYFRQILSLLEFNRVLYVVLDKVLFSPACDDNVL